MSADQTPVRRPAPVTQRDGSPLQFSNCRMGSIATGIDYETGGATTSTGGKMRSYTDDQSGGTSSADARQSWRRGYDQALIVRDGSTFDDALADLRAGRLVHLDVWHQTVGGPCLSGSGRYGHTLAVAPDCKDGAWLVADPWCKPPTWVRVTEARLRAGAERWGAMVYGEAGATSGPAFAAVAADRPPPADPIRVDQIVKRLMTEATPVSPAPVDPPSLMSADTAGPRPILYTVTARQPLAGGTDDMGIAYRPLRWDDPGVALYLDSNCTDKVTETQPGGQITTIGAIAKRDPDGADYTALAVLVVTGKLRDDGAPTRAVLWCRRSDLGPSAAVDSVPWQDSIWTLADQPSGRYPCPDGGDCEDPDEVRAERDDEWMNWLLAGSPAQESDPG